MELYDLMIRELETRYTLRMQKIEQSYDARINAIKQEFEAYKNKKLDELSARLTELNDVLSRFIQVNLATFNGNLQRLSDQTLMSAGFNRDTLLTMYLAGQFDKLLDALSTIALYITPGERTALDQMLNIVDQYYDLVSRYRLLQEIAQVSIEEREARMNAMIQRLMSEKIARINELKAELEDKKAIQEKKKVLERISLERRISSLERKVEEYSVELSSIERQLQALHAAG